MLFPYLAVTFTALFWSLPRKCSQFCSLELNYSKYLSHSSSTLIFLGFSKEGLSSWRWPKFILTNKYQRTQTSQGSTTEDKEPHPVWIHATGIPKPLRCQAQFHSLCTSETSQGQLPRAQPTCNPEGHLTPRRSGLENCITARTGPAVSITR